MANSDLLVASQKFDKVLREIKSRYPEVNWYPYGSLGNFYHLAPLFEVYSLQDLAPSKRVADIGGADGDLAFFLSSLGFAVDALEWPPTNMNALEGFKTLARALNSDVSLSITDIDTTLELPHSDYECIFFSGFCTTLRTRYLS